MQTTVRKARAAIGDRVPQGEPSGENRGTAGRNRVAVECFHDAVRHLVDGRIEPAERLFRRALSFAPHLAEAHTNLAAIAELRGDFDTAVTAYQASLRLNGDQPQVLTNLGDVLHRLNRHAEALHAYGTALELLPNDLDTLNNLGLTLKVMGHFAEAEQCYRTVLRLDDRHLRARDNLGLILVAQGKRLQAVKVFKETLALGLDESRAGHLLAALCDGLSDRAPASYVRQLFDAAAPGFDRHLVEQLGYNLPLRLAEALSVQYPARVFERGLDLGCGTGLVGAAVAPQVKWLAGVDLSSKMLEQAKRRGCYQALHCQDMLELLAADPVEDGYDLIIAADVFIYHGDLEPVFVQVHRLLRPQGVFAFSTELGTEGCFHLRPTGRFAHSVKYIEDLTADRFAIVRCERVDLRLEQGESLAGMFFMMLPKTA